MKQFATTITVLFILLLTASLLLAGDEEKTGKLDLSALVFDFGSVPQDAKVIHNFILKNVGNDTLNILGVKPT